MRFLMCECSQFRVFGGEKVAPLCLTDEPQWHSAATLALNHSYLLEICTPPPRLTTRVDPRRALEVERAIRGLAVAVFFVVELRVFGAAFGLGAAFFFITEVFGLGLVAFAFGFDLAASFTWLPGKIRLTPLCRFENRPGLSFFSCARLS